MIKTWGQTPKQLFTSSHPQSQQQSPIKKSLSTIFTNSNTSQTSSSSTSSLNLVGKRDSIHRCVLNVKWGTYVGSLDQPQAPVCVWKESNKKNIVSLVNLASNEVIGLAQYRCLLLDRTKDSGIYVTKNIICLYI